VLYLSISNRGINELEHSGIQGGVDTERGLLALARELQTSLYYIAREAELGSKDALQVISDSAEYALRLIDSYLIASQVERGQLHLNLEPVALGSVLHDTKYALATSCRVEEHRAHCS
jgi:signal transduction histidine kinase